MSSAAHDGTIESHSLEVETYPPSAEFAEQANVHDSSVYWRAAEDHEAYWASRARDLQWTKPFTEVLDWSNPPFAKWFQDGELNVAANCLDRHIAAGLADRVAIHWEGEPGDTRTITYGELTHEVKRAANMLTALGITQGDRVAIYLPMIPEAVISMLAVARLGATHSVVFGGFSADSLRSRIDDAEAKIVITADGGYRKGRVSQLKPTVDEALALEGDGSPLSVEHVLVVDRCGSEVAMQPRRDLWWHEEISAFDGEHTAKGFPAENPLFILYTSGTTGKPKGILHTSGGYLTQVTATHNDVFDLKPETDVFWCTADVGWVTGHSYIVYAPLCNGGTTIMFEGVPNYPTYSRFWQIVEKYKVNIFYTAPTAIRAIAKEGDDFVKKHDISSLQTLGTVGEPINPEAWNWYFNLIGRGECPIVDTWWQTETGGILITPLPGAIEIKPGMATMPFFGVQPVLVDDEGKEFKETVASGSLCIKVPWPGIMRGVYKDPKRFQETYFEQFPGYYVTGDGCRRDKDGYYQITGRVDDVINVSGHRMGTAEVESALVAHKAVAEAAVVGMPHNIKGQGIYAYVTLKTGVEKSDELKKELVAHVRVVIGPIATPDKIQWADALPKTRSGKIMRRILKKVAANELDSLGDTSTLADPSVVDEIVKNRQ